MPFPLKVGKLTTTSLAYGFYQVGVGVTDKVLKRLLLTVLFAHKQHGYRG